MLGFILINIRNRGLKQPESRMTTGQYDVYFASRAQVVSRSPYHLVRSFRIGANGASIAPAPPGSRGHWKRAEKRRRRPPRFRDAAFMLFLLIF